MRVLLEKDIVMLGFFLSALLAVAPPQMQATSQTATEAAVKNPVVASGKVSTPVKPELSPTSPVITIHGLCQGAKASRTKPSACTTAVTKEQFDTVVTALNAIGPQLLAPQRRVVAEGYANMLVNTEAARKAGVERDPRFAEVMRLARMRAMGDMYNALMLEKAKQISPARIEQYYKQNIDKFEELSMRRIAVPRFNDMDLKDSKFAAQAREVAREMQERAAKGDDLDKLEKEAFDALKLQNPLKTTMGPVRRGLFSADEEKQLFALKPGDVTSVVELPSAFVIYKLESRKTLKLDEVKDEIRQTLTKQKLDEQKHANDKLIKIVYDEQYVGPPNPSEWMSARQLSKEQKQTPKPAAQNAEPKK